MQRVFPVLNLSITREKQLLPTNFQEKDDTGVVHGRIQNTDEAEHLIASERAQLADEPAIMRREEVLENIGIRKQSRIAGSETPNQFRGCRLQAPELLCGRLQHPEFVFVVCALILYLCMLLERGWTKETQADARQQL